MVRTQINWIFLFILYIGELVKGYIDYNKIRFEKKLIYLFISSTIILFNYFCFGKPTLWIKNSNKENEE